MNTREECLHYECKHRARDLIALWSTGIDGRNEATLVNAYSRTFVRETEINDPDSIADVFIR